MEQDQNHSIPSPLKQTTVPNNGGKVLLFEFHAKQKTARNFSDFPFHMQSPKACSFRRFPFPHCCEKVIPILARYGAHHISNPNHPTIKIKQIKNLCTSEQNLWYPVWDGYDMEYFLMYQDLQPPQLGKQVPLQIGIKSQYNQEAKLSHQIRSRGSSLIIGNGNINIAADVVKTSQMLCVRKY